MMQITMKTEGLDKVRGIMQRLSGPELAQASAAALNDTAFQVRRAMMDELASVFDRPTPFIAKSPKFVGATPDRMAVIILPTLDARKAWGEGGKIGVDPQDVLQAQGQGGRRRDKRSEVALHRAGILPAGYQTSIPKDPFPGSDDGRGNLRGAFVAQLISYLQAYGEQGYKANMGKKGIAKIADRTGISSIQTRKTYSAIRGVVYFATHGSLRDGRAQHFAPGIWAKTGTHGSDVRPVIMFVRHAKYTARLSMDRVAQAANADAHLARRMRFRIRQLVEKGTFDDRTVLREAGFLAQSLGV